MPETKVDSVESEIDADLEADKSSKEADTKYNNTVNAAVKSHMKRLSRDLQAQFVSILDERLGKPKESVDVDETDVEDVKVKSKSGDNSGEIQKLRKELQAQKAERELEKQQAQLEKAISDAKSHLAGKVRPEALNHVIKLISHDKLIQIAKDGTKSFKLGEDEYDLEDGLNAWLKSSDAALFLPAPSVNSKSVAKKPTFKPGIRNDKVVTPNKLDPRSKTLQDWAKLSQS